ncbi:MAG: divergent polysaccharide deacetylase family protein [Proteobacteria bacterium]|nr:divergent polysaccharide deacetylase family protein [Pseudomonadota bacterium]
MGVLRSGRPWGRRRGDRRLWLVWRGVWLFGGVFSAGLAIGTSVGLLLGSGGASRGLATGGTAEGGPTWESVSDPGLPPVAAALPDSPPAAVPASASRPGPPPAAASGVPPWQRYAVAAVHADGRPMIAVVMDDLGVDRPRTARTIALRRPLTMAFLPYARDVAAQAAHARAAGHELIVHLPMEPDGTNADPGPRPLLVGLPREELLARLGADLATIGEYVGVSNHMGSRFTSDPEAMALVMGVLKERGLAFLDSRTAPTTVGAEVAERFGVPFAQRDVFLDNEDSPAAIRRQIQTVEDTARQHGYAIAIGHPRDATLEALAEWLGTVEGRGFALVPLSAVLRAGGTVRAAQR